MTQRDTGTPVQWRCNLMDLGIDIDTIEEFMDDIEGGFYNKDQKISKYLDFVNKNLRRTTEEHKRTRWHSRRGADWSEQDED